MVFSIVVVPFAVGDAVSVETVRDGYVRPVNRTAAGIEVRVDVSGNGAVDRVDVPDGYGDPVITVVAHGGAVDRDGAARRVESRYRSCR